MIGAEPIGIEEFDSLLSPLLSDAELSLAPHDGEPDSSSRLALAVSGGPDSMALMHLVARWLHSGRAGELAGHPDAVLVLTVDHGLRSEATAEAARVAAAAAALGLRHTTLQWREPKPPAGVQAAARRARYRLIHDQLLQEATREGRPIRVLVTGHTADDQAETLLMRLARGSGLEGLAAMRSRTTLSIHGGDGGGRQGCIVVLRPLLGQPKARLIQTMAHLGSCWIDDPSNRDFRFERVRIRETMKQLRSAGIVADAVALSAARLGRAQDAIEHGAAELARVCLDHHQGAYATVDLARLSEAPAALGILLLSRVLVAHGGRGQASVDDGGTPRLEQLETLHRQLLEAASRHNPDRLRMRTLAGCLIEITNVAARAELRVTREPGRKGCGAIRLVPGSTGTWDGRFRVSLLERSLGPIDVRALPDTAWPALCRASPALETARIPVRVRRSLPSLWRDDTLLAIPHLASLAAGLAGSVKLNSQTEISNVSTGDGSQWEVVLTFLNGERARSQC